MLNFKIGLTKYKEQSDKKFTNILEMNKIILNKHVQIEYALDMYEFKCHLF